jgi:WD40 repeat protein
MFDISTGKELSRLSLNKNTFGLALGPGARYVAAREYEGRTVRMYDMSKQKEIWSFDHDQAVIATVFSPDGRYLATGGADRTAWILEAATGRRISQITLPGPVVGLRFTPEQRFLLTASFDIASSKLAVVLSRHPIKPDDLLDEACSRLTRNFTFPEWKLYFGADMTFHKTCPNLP